MPVVPRSLALPVLTVLLSLVVGMGGCQSRRADIASPAPRPGIDQWSLRTGSARSVTGCRYEYRVFEPAGSAALSVVLGHGFLRDQDRMVGLARALVDAGHRTITLDFCSMRPWNGHHVDNAADMNALAAREGIAGATVYAGFSAGALAALIAAADDANAAGVLTLDLVDQAELGARAADRLAAPLVSLTGPPSACNAGASAHDALDITPVQIADASHCAFESPTDWLCELACGDTGDDTGQRDTIVRRAVAEIARFAEPTSEARPVP